MASLFRWSFRLLLLLLSLTLLTLLIVYYLSSRSLPNYEAEVNVDGIRSPVEIVYNNSAIPHIFGASDTDVYFGLGFAHAQNRLWQMIMLRRTAQGRLSEMFGERTLKIDELMRRLDIYGAARNSFFAFDDAGADILKAYSAGVNARLRQVANEALGRGAPELFLFSPEIAPWTPADSISILKVMALQQTGHLEQEVIRARASLQLGPERLLDLLPDSPGNGTAVLDFAALFPKFEPEISFAEAKVKADVLFPIAAPGLSGASNAFAAAPSRSARGAALLANDPHHSLTAPSLWYLARLQLSGGGVIGATVPGIPMTLIGRSETIGWGATASYGDDQDLIIEQLNPDNTAQYLTPEGYVSFETRQSVIEVADQEPVTIELRWSRNGPILPSEYFDLDKITPRGHVVALGWTAFDENDTSIQSIQRAMTARDQSEFIEALRGVVAPSYNMVIADTEGVGMKTIGHLPRRNVDHQSQGRIPAPGWVDENIWNGVLPYASNPEFKNPSGGIVGNTNNKAIDRPFPDHVSFHYGDTQRVNRWRRLMTNREVHTRDSFVEAQLDTVSFSARSLLPLIAADLWYTGDAAPEGSLEKQRQRALALMAEWNGEMSEHLPEPLIYAAWMRALQDRLIRDDIGVLADAFTHVEPLFIERVYRDIDGASAWCDVLQSAPVETCTDASRAALDDAIVWLTDRYGENIESWRWGDAHEALHLHQVLGTMPLIRAFANIRQSSSGGDNTLMRGKTIGTGPNPFQNVHGAAYRGVYDFTDPDSSLFVISTGQSGHLLSRHYDDLGDLWQRGEYVPMSLDPDLARAGAAGITTLTPKSAK